MNPIANPRALDDFSVENELMLTMDNLVGYKGDVTNDQADCGLVFVAQAKDGQVDAVKAELEAYKGRACPPMICMLSLQTRSRWQRMPAS